MSFLKSALEVELVPARAVFNVSVLPFVTSIALLAWFKVNVLDVANVPKARKPAPVAAFTFSLTPFSELPRAASVAAATTPPWMSINRPDPPNVLLPAPRTRVPFPFFRIPKAPDMPPDNVSPGTRFDAVALETVIVGAPVKVVAPVKSTP